jgi:tRNA dimethylallyltransferase
MATKTVKPLVVIVGPTASGKTALSIKLAKQFNGEIICADSRTIYKGMDIGTAKPTTKEREGVPHWGLDLIEPGDYFTVADFKKYANQKTKEIKNRNKIPFLVGGSGLYVDAVLFDYQFGPSVNQSLRTKLNNLSLEQLYEHCYKNNTLLPENNKNKRYIIRAIEQGGLSGQRPREPINDTIVVGIATDKDALLNRIKYRAKQIFNNNVVNEAIMLSKKYGWNNEAMSGIVYRVIREHLVNNSPISEAVDKFATLDWKLAKRQMTWFKHNSYIKWLSLEDARIYIDECLAIEQ